MAARKRQRTSASTKATVQRGKRRNKALSSNARSLTGMFKWVCPNDDNFSALALHGNTSWRPMALVWLALCWAWAESKNVTSAFDVALGQCRQLGQNSLSTYQGFMYALETWSERLMACMRPQLHERMQRIGQEFWQVGGWVPIAFDGSRNTVPRSVSNEKAFCAANFGHGKTARFRKKKTQGMRRRNNERNKPQPPAPQAWITLMWHMGLRLPWSWRLDASNASERGHVLQMLKDEEFPRNTLFCGDAGFVGYSFWEPLLARGFHFMVRVGGNMNLLTEMANCRIRDRKVFCWPKGTMNAGQPPLQLRLVRVKIGKTRVWLLTSVLESTALSRQQMVQLYKMRWGIEVEFRGLKQTLGRAKLRCRNAHRALAELDWSLMALAVAELLALRVQLGSGRSQSAPESPPPDPSRRSLAKTLWAVRRCLYQFFEASLPGESLWQQLRAAITDDYQRKASKKARYRPLNKDKKPLGDPNIRQLNALERCKLRTIQPINAAA